MSLSQDLTAQVWLKTALPLAEILATSSDRCSNTGPRFTHRRTAPINQDKLSAYSVSLAIITLIARFMGSTWGPFGADMTLVAPWTLHSGQWSFLLPTFSIRNEAASGTRRPNLGIPLGNFLQRIPLQCQHTLPLAQIWFHYVHVMLSKCTCNAKPNSNFRRTFTTSNAIFYVDMAVNSLKTKFVEFWDIAKPMVYITDH